MSTFLHPIFSSSVIGGAAAGAKAAQWLFHQVAAKAVDTAVDAGIGIVADQYEYWTGASDEQITNSTVESMTQALAVVTSDISEDVAKQNDALVNRLLSEIQSRDGGPKAMAEAFDDRNKEFTFLDATGQSIVSAGKIVGCALGELQAENSIFKKSHFPNDSKPANFIRRCSTKSSDGKRVSRQPHEWSYVRESGQWGRIMQLAMDWGDGIYGGEPEYDNLPPEYRSAVEVAFEAIQTNGISSDQQDYTYGNFVDMKRTRKAIERYRKLQRIVRSANSKQILELLGQTQEQFSTLLEDNGRWLDVLEEMVNQNVRTGSQQTGTLPSSAQLDETPGVND